MRRKKNLKVKVMTSAINYVSCKWAKQCIKWVVLSRWQFLTLLLLTVPIHDIIRLILLTCRYLNFIFAWNRSFHNLLLEYFFLLYRGRSVVVAAVLLFRRNEKAFKCANEWEEGEMWNFTFLLSSVWFDYIYLRNK